jgi:hypothetical protein
MNITMGAKFCSEKKEKRKKRKENLGYIIGAK